LDQSTDRGTIPSDVNSYLYTRLTDEENNERIRVSYLSEITHIMAIAFSASLVTVTYHLAGFIAAERESNMSQLLEAMLPGRQRWKSTVVRILSYHLAFTISYLPGMFFLV